MLHAPRLPRRDVLLAAASACCLLPFIAGADPEPGVFATREVAPGIHVREGIDEEATADNAGAIANLAFIIGRDAVAVVDPGGSLADGARWRDTIRAITKVPIRYVILSHVHPDHIFGAGAFAADNRSMSDTRACRARLPSAGSITAVASSRYSDAARPVRS
jgi:glyoxylase-like metal-dependent hydrolase (beta-lactamase superfamily II)